MLYKIKLKKKILFINIVFKSIKFHYRVTKIMENLKDLFLIY